MGIVGCGAIGSTLALVLQRPPWVSSFQLVGVHDQDLKKARALARRLSGRIPVLSLTALIQRSRLLVEATSAAAAATIVRQALRARRTVVALSVGGLLPLQRRLASLTREGGRLLIPSGAIAGLDAIKAARLGGLRRVTLTTRKPPRTLMDAPGARRLRARLLTTRRPLELFRGSATRAVEAFPQNINVAATLALAGLGSARTEVRMVADPSVHQNIHEIEAVGAIGRCRFRLENRPARANPKTSQLAIWSALATLHQLTEGYRVGT